MRTKLSLSTVRILMAVLSALLVLFFFLPIFTVSGNSYGIDIGFGYSMANMSFGTEIMGQKVPGVIISVATLILPAVLAVFWIIKADKTTAVLTIVFCAITAFLYILFTGMINAALSAAGMYSAGGSAHMTPLAVLAVIVLIVMIVISIMIRKEKIR